ncbi:alanine racemase [Granulosicoccus sp. 3-233]|uniref:alanine racemase n=1 Tax=Granulosicoccus sp. 3-233 TaxID=3417969 RepID=UPI003D33C701
MNRRSVTITVNLPALRQNLATARRLSGGCRQFATIKADAYGHGAVAVAHALSPRASKRQYSEPASATNEPTVAVADGFAVVTLEEALELRQSGIRQAILVLQGPQNGESASQMKRHQFWPVIHDRHQYEWFRQHPDCGELRAWLKVDSGMGRLGFQPEEAARILASDDKVFWSGLMTHFACADETGNPFTEQQVSRFNGVQPPMALQRSMANSAAVLAWPISRADWARPGIMLYGCNPLDRELANDVVLHPVMTVEAPLISVKLMKRGAGIGYAQAWRCPEDMPIGYVAAGYRDGIPRVLDESARVSIAGCQCPVVGRVSMDSFAVDLRQVPEARVGDAVELWGKNNPIDELARAAGTISYELLTSIRGKRIYIDR